MKNKKFSALFASSVMVLSVIAGFCIYYLVLGNPENFVDNDITKHPVEEGAGHVMGLMFKGGPVVGILISLLLIVLTISIERLITLAGATGKGSVDDFTHKIKGLLNSGQVSTAIAECDRQKGSVANIVKSGLEKYDEMLNETEMSQDQKILAIKAEIEESTALELPMLQKNLVIISTIASVATLIALLGTVLGMIKSFAAIATAGAPDTAALSTGISEALINTALGIGISAIAIIIYNVFSTRIDKLTFNVDEANFTITQSFATHSFATKVK